MSPFNSYELPKGKIYNGDCMKVMDELIEQNTRFDAIILDPPYFKSQPLPKWRASGNPAFQIVEYWKPPNYMLLAKRLKVLLKKSGVIWLFGYMPYLAQDAHPAFTKFSLRFLTDMLWIKTKSGMADGKHPVKAHVHLWAYCNNDVKMDDLSFDVRRAASPSGNLKTHKVRPEGYVGLKGEEKRFRTPDKSIASRLKSDGDIYYYTDIHYPKSYILTRVVDQFHPEYLHHPTATPTEVMELLIKLSCPNNGTVLDPYLGSGSSAVVCERLNINYVGIEISEEWCKKARDRILKSIEDDKAKRIEHYHDENAEEAKVEPKAETTEGIDAWL